MKWCLTIERGYRAIRFIFDSLSEVEAFMLTWIDCKVDNDGYEESKKDRFSIEPVTEREEQDNAED